MLCLKVTLNTLVLYVTQFFKIVFVLLSIFQRGIAHYFFGFVSKYLFLFIQIIFFGSDLNTKVTTWNNLKPLIKCITRKCWISSIFGDWKSFAFSPWLCNLTRSGQMQCSCIFSTVVVLLTNCSQVCIGLAPKISC